MTGLRADTSRRTDVRTDGDRGPIKTEKLMSAMNNVACKMAGEEGGGEGRHILTCSLSNTHYTVSGKKGAT